MKKTYKIQFDWWTCTIEFDPTLFTKVLLDECLDFFSWEYDEDDDPYEEYAKKLALEIIIESMLKNREGVIRIFNEKEGFPPLDGSMGVSLMQCECWRFYSDDFEIVNE